MIEIDELINKHRIYPCIIGALFSSVDGKYGVRFPPGLFEIVYSWKIDKFHIFYHNIKFKLLAIE